MLRLDSVKIKVPFSAIDSINESAFFEQKIRKGGILIADKLNAKNIGLGLKSIQIDNIKSDVIVEFSAKILKAQYFDLININSIGQCFDAINSSGALRLKVNDAVEVSDVLRCDVTKNLKVGGAVKQYISSLHHLRVNNKYKVEEWNKKRNNGIVFQGKQTSFKERMIFYDKLMDAMKDDQLQKEVPLPKLLTQFVGVLRCEANIAQLRKIRELCGGSNNLLSLLKSNSNPNLFLFNKIKEKCINLELFSRYDGMKLYELEKLLGQQTIIKELHYDMSLISDFLESRVQGNISRYKRRYRSVCLEMLSDKDEIEDNRLLKEIEQQLMVA